MAIYTDTGTIASKTTPSGSEHSDYQLVATLTGTTTISGSEIGQYVDLATIAGITSIDQSYLTEVYIVATTDYNWSAWNITVTSGGYQTAGSVGGFDNDHGEIG